MPHHTTFPAAAALLAAALGAVAGEPAPAGDPAGPFVILYDTAAAAGEAITAAALEAKKGWALVPEETTAHTFRGDAVFLNDKVAVAIRARGSGAEAYARSDRGFTPRAVVGPLGGGASDGDGDRSTSLAKLTIRKNATSAVEVEVACSLKKGGRASFSLRLAAGENTVELAGGEGTRALAVFGEPERIVLPDFFGDDYVFVPAAGASGRAALPAENMLLSLVGAGDALVMAVWQSPLQVADALLERTDRGARTAGFSVGCDSGQRLWVAFLEHRGLWHELPLEGATAESSIPWLPPFQAQWRADFLGLDGGVARSAPLADSAKDAADAASGAPAAASVLCYPIDRNRATPLSVFCPIDVMRSALGIGPCQYVLAMESLGDADPATPEFVTAWVDQQFRRNRDGKSSDEIAGRLAAMARHLIGQRDRIERYGAFARGLRERCRGAAAQPSTAAAAAAIDKLAAAMDGRLAVLAARLEPVGAAEKLAGDLAGLAGAKAGRERHVELGERLRTIGLGYDRALAAGRLHTRLIACECRMLLARGDAGRDFAAPIAEQAAAALAKGRAATGEKP